MIAQGRIDRAGGFLLAALATAWACGPAQAHPEGHGPAGAAPAAASAAASVEGTRDAQTYFTDTGLVTQDGKPVRFYSDVLKDRTVLINVVFTSCEDACPLITKKLMEVRAKLGNRFGKDIRFVSLSIDPARDSPQALKKFARTHGVDESGWVFLTGAKADLDRVLARLGQLSPVPEEHSTLLIAGNVGAKRWSKIRPDAPPGAIAERLHTLAGSLP